MNDYLKLIILLIVTTASLRAVAETVPHDTVYLYNSWQGMMYHVPDCHMVDPIIDAASTCEVYIETHSDYLNGKIEKAIGISLGDSVFMINTDYLRANFKGDVGRMHGFVPFFMNEKAAYVVYSGKVSFKSILFGDMNDNRNSVACYYIDFLNRKILKVNARNLNRMLADYRNLQMRYEGMDSQDSKVIEYFFQEYINEVTNDPSHPYILDLMN